MSLTAFWGTCWDSATILFSFWSTRVTSRSSVHITKMMFCGQNHFTDQVHRWTRRNTTKSSASSVGTVFMGVLSATLHVTWIDYHNLRCTGSLPWHFRGDNSHQTQGEVRGINISVFQIHDVLNPYPKHQPTEQLHCHYQGALKKVATLKNMWDSQISSLIQ